MRADRQPGRRQQSLFTVLQSAQKCQYPPHTHDVIMCFVRISKRTVIISLCKLNLFVFITGTDSVYCVVRNESLNIIHIYFYL